MAYSPWGRQEPDMTERLTHSLSRVLWDLGSPSGD